MDPENISEAAGRKAVSCVIAIFGVTGDLAFKKIMPALFNLYCLGYLDVKTRIVGIGRREYSRAQYAGRIGESLAAASPAKGPRSGFLQNAGYVRGFIDMNDYINADFTKEESFAAIRESLKAVAVEHKICNFLYYLSTPPQNFTGIISGLGASGLSKPDFLDVSCAGSFVRAVVEKPYGYDIDSARELNGLVLSIFSEDQIYRIDHYLGKETVQNIMVFRFLNGIFEPIWNQKYIDNVHIRVFETDGIGTRANYFDRAGIMRDIIQNHSLQMLSLIAMEPAVSMKAENIRNEKLKVLSSIRPFDPKKGEKCLLRAQYAAGKGGLKAYADEPGVPKDSKTETFAAIKLHIDNWRWAGVPFYLAAGKRMHKRLTEVVVNFKPAPHLMLNKTFAGAPPSANRITIRVQPDEGISLKIFSKAPGFNMEPQPVSMDFNYSTSFKDALPEAYERLILDALSGDATLFMRSDEIEAAWEFMTPVIKYASEGASRLELYEAGSPGPDLCNFSGANIC